VERFDTTRLVRVQLQLSDGTAFNLTPERARWLAQRLLDTANLVEHVEAADA
jgi:hypothetical protein